jgi:3-hydroxyisobutyrate dehydrogenase
LIPLDAPVSGGVKGAANATLTFMVGGADEAFERAKSFLEAMGKNIVHAGGAGNGQAAKICNNMLLGISMIGTCEAFALAEKLGLDHQKLFDISAKASGQCWSMTSYCPVPGVGPTTPADNGYQGGFATALMLKDLTLALAAADEAGVEPEMGKRARELYESFAAAGNGGAGGAADDEEGAERGTLRGVRP